MNVTFVDIEDKSGIATYAVITHDDGSQTSMLKSVYEAQQAASTLPSNSADPVEAEKPKK